MQASKSKSKQPRDKIARLMKRQNNSVLDQNRAKVIASDSDDSDEDEDLMVLKRKDHALVGGGGDEDAEAESEQALKRMSRKQRKLEKQRQRNLELGVEPGNMVRPRPPGLAQSLLP